MPCCERAIESPHGQIQLKVHKKRTLPSYISWAIRSPQLRQLLQEPNEGHIREAAFVALCECYDEVSSPKGLVRSMYLDHHPLYVQLQGAQVWRHSDRSRKFITQALYRTDLPSLFQSLKPARRHHCRALARALRRRPQLRPQARRVESLLAITGFEHIRTLAQPTAIHSLPRNAVQLHSVHAAMGVAPDAPELMPDQNDLLFVRFLHTHPSRMKTLGSQERLNPGDLAISVHSNSGTAAAPTVTLDAAEAEQIACIMRGLDLCEHDVLKQVNKWTCAPGQLSHAIRGFTSDHGPAALHEALQAFFQADVFRMMGFSFQDSLKCLLCTEAKISNLEFPLC